MLTLVITTTLSKCKITEFSRLWGFSLNVDLMNNSSLKNIHFRTSQGAQRAPIYWLGIFYNNYNNYNNEAEYDMKNYTDR